SKEKNGQRRAVARLSCRELNNCSAKKEDLRSCWMSWTLKPSRKEDPKGAMKAPQEKDLQTKQSHQAFASSRIICSVFVFVVAIKNRPELHGDRYFKGAGDLKDVPVEVALLQIMNQHTHLQTHSRLIFNLPKLTHVTPLLRSLHWLPVVARIRFKTLMLAYKAKNGPAPPYLMAMVKSRAVPRALRASSTARIEPPSLRTHGRQASRLFSVLAPRWWNELPLDVRTAESLPVFKRRLKTHLFVMHLGTSTGPLFGQCLSS
ncbi:hypothetical protein NFI96_028414, partial [Prochilodus magdalenae]